ncbi:sensor histidine kinase [Nocardia sp. alder85J]|uniref:sensor histidine kinase n=1 Tax=Nocardia sp. alder85J TaxID=2862949 RepID=UPI001CD70154|nr:HAMP domain-containing sensor histidine kinase [Nocardia sp. alder85J]MCX4094348.1 HAMP domain-containing sensor histidine kinase [Nocardia sp. alder85J]
MSSRELSPPGRALSLRTRVALSTALGALIVVAGLAAAISVGIARNNIDHLDRELDTAAQLLALNADTAEPVLGRLGDVGAFAVSMRIDDRPVAATTTRIPVLPEGFHTVDIDRVRYRVDSVTTVRDGERLAISVAVPIREAQTITRTQQRRVLLLGAMAVLVASGLGWLFGGLAVRPLVELARRIGQGAPLPAASGPIREANQVTAEVADMLGRIRDAHARTDSALESARTFAASAAHELRTPLTAMRTDLEVMRGLDLPREQRTEILDDVLRKQNGVESTLTALELLASGELIRTDRRVAADVVELADEAVHDATRRYPGADIRVSSEPPLIADVLVTGVRLALDNAIANAIKHGRATRIDIAAELTADQRLRITVDDDGRGIPPEERAAVFARFHRGSGAARDGSGLGLALVAQQAQLHGGRAFFTDSPLGGIRLVLDLAAARGADADRQDHATKPHRPLRVRFPVR